MYRNLSSEDTIDLAEDQPSDIMSQIYMLQQTLLLRQVITEQT